ncbi:hypothetical protein ABW19_dt0206139 [Dactylella cylindrospora]|nr:hypothetical protein ABW19_dt0206139 [Dactylella cylindrospora]
MIESCHQTQHGFGIWADQGFQYLKRRGAWDSFEQDGDKVSLKRSILSPETRPLIEMYGVSGDERPLGEGVPKSKDSDTILHQLQRFGVKSIRGAEVQEEQEREIAHELEQQQHPERPPPAKPRGHQLHPDLNNLVDRGIFFAKSTAFWHPFNVFFQTSARGMTELHSWESQVYATTDFLQTVEPREETNINDYLRSVRWILRRLNGSELFLISPYEANLLMPSIRASQFCSLHCYAPRTSRSMRSFDLLDFCPISAASKTDLTQTPSMRTRLSLNIFAGQLFFQDSNYYRQLCEHLELYFDDPEGDYERGGDGWMSQSTRRTLGLTSPDATTSLRLSRSPVDFLDEITKMRRKGQGFALTHWGAVLSARVLTETDF